jgi:FdhD protein
MATTTPPAGESEAPRRTLRVVGEERPPGAEAIPAAPQAAVEIWRVSPAGAARERDALAVEEPLEIRLRAGGEERTVALTMRTPGHDAELAAGFLFAEGIVRGRGDLAGVEHRPDGEDAGHDPGNVVVAELAAAALPDLAPLERHFFATSACGVCGKAGLESLHQAGHGPLPAGFTVDRRVLAALPERLRGGQGIFDATGGLHAAALFDAAGELLAVREDVGRHNALDKLIGWALLEGRLPLSEGVVMVSGRSSYEILQKCLAAGVPVVASVSAPSSLAVQLAETFHVTLIGFLRGDRFNVYAAPERVVGAA